MMEMLCFIGGLIIGILSMIFVEGILLKMWL